MPPWKAAASKSRTGRAPKRTTARRVLIVEDDPETAAAVTTALQRAGIVTDVLHDAAVATRAIREERCQPDVVLLDYALPGGDASDVVGAIARSRSDAGVVLLTGQPEAVATSAAQRLRVDALVLKPAAMAVVLEAVEVAAAARQGRRQPLTLTAPRPTGSSVGRPEADPADLIFDLFLEVLGVPNLSPARRRSLVARLRGFDDGAIADKNGISKSRVREHCSAARFGLGIEDPHGILRKLAERAADALTSVHMRDAGFPVDIGQQAAALLSSVTTARAAAQSQHPKG
jgi:DNA-binding NarL/FixJ family response regulator